MDPRGEWRLAPAYDVIYAYNPDGRWTNRHQMSMAGKRDDLTRGDMLTVARTVGVKKADAIIDQVRGALADWPRCADKAGVPVEQASRVGGTFREFGAAPPRS